MNFQNQLDWFVQVKTFYLLCLTQATFICGSHTILLDIFCFQDFLIALKNLRGKLITNSFQRKRNLNKRSSEKLMMNLQYKLTTLRRELKRWSLDVITLLYFMIQESYSGFNCQKKPPSKKLRLFKSPNSKIDSSMMLRLAS